MSTLHAPHRSDRASSHVSTAPATPLASQPYVAGVSTIPSSYFELKGLTQNAVGAPREKNTPPHTPRSSSNEGTPTRGQPRPPTSIPLDQDGAEESAHLVNGQSALDRAAAMTTTGPSGPAAAAVGPPKGKLSVKVVRARGLRPSRDPYVVCVFEANESISKGPKPGGDKNGLEGGLAANGLGSVAIKRAVSDIGRAVAIPMKSRQNSTTSLSDGKESKEAKNVIDPRWDHEATL